MKKHIPNALTLLNLVCGCLGIIACFTPERAVFVPLFIGIALLADFLDGFAARILNVKSDLGAQLDSLADMVTFGVLPGVMLYKIFGSISIYDTQIFGRFLKSIALIYPVFACLRLANFNIDSRQQEHFIGLPTPAAAILILGLYGKYYLDGFNVPPFIFSSYGLVIITFFTSYIMVAEVPLFSMKGRPLSWEENKYRVLFLISCIPQLLFLEWIGLSTVIVTYVLFSMRNNRTKKNTTTT